MSASTINTNASQPKRVTVDGTTAEQHPIPDQIAADRYAATNVAKTSKKFGIRLAQLRNQGTA